MKISVCNNIKENCYKMLYRQYITPKKLANTNNKICNKCWKYHEKEGSLYRIWWTIDKTRQYWMVIHSEIVKILQCNIKKTPRLFLLELNMELINVIDRTALWCDYCS